MKKKVTMETIKERAKAFSEDKNNCDVCDGKSYCPCEKFTSNYNMYIQIATEQDKIARQEERERCIRIATFEHCRLCHYYSEIDNVCVSTHPCDDSKLIRKAMEGGEE